MIRVAGSIIRPHPIIVGSTSTKKGITVTGNTGTYGSYLGIGAGACLPLYFKAGLIRGVVLPGEVDLRGRYGGSYQVRRGIH